MLLCSFLIGRIAYNLQLYEAPARFDNESDDKH